MRSSDRWELVSFTLSPWIGPLVTFFRNDQDRWAFLFWPLVYAAIGTYLSQPGRLLKRRDGGGWRYFAYGARVSSLLLLCLFEIIANSLAPPLERFTIAIALFVPYWFAARLALHAEINLRSAQLRCEGMPAREPGASAARNREPS